MGVWIGEIRASALVTGIEIQNEGEVTGIAIYSEKIAENERKIEQLEKHIKRDTDKRKKLIEENSRLSYLALCEEYNCSGQDLLDIIRNEHQQIESIKASGLSEKDIADLAGSGHVSDSVDDEEQMSFYDSSDNDND